MVELLRRAGVSSEVLELVPQITESCRVCREWSRPGAKIKVSGSLTTTFNATVELDLLFYKESIIGHLLDVCIKWSSTALVADRTVGSLLSFISRSWVNVFGPMKILVSDNEGAIASEEAGLILKRLGVERRLRAPGQHAVSVERHHELIRQLLHKLEGHCLLYTSPSPRD